MITVFPNRKRFPIILTICLLMSAWVIWNLSASASEAYRRNLGGEILQSIFLTIILATTIISAVSYLYIIRSPNAKLMINEEGIDDRLTIFSIGFVRWSNIAGVEVRTILGIDVLLIKLRDPDSVVALQPQWKRRRLRRAMKKLGTPMIVSQYIIDYNINDLTRQIKMRLDD